MSQTMSEEHEQHLENIKYDFTRMVDAKYRKGNEEHGGKLWEKHDLIDQAIDEAIDQVVYLLTLKQQIHDGKL